MKRRFPALLTAGLLFFGCVSAETVPEANLYFPAGMSRIKKNKRSKEQWIRNF